MDATSYEDVEFLIANLILFFKGGFTWQTLMNMPLPTLNRWITYANRINEDQKNEMERAKKGGK